MSAVTPIAVATARGKLAYSKSEDRLVPRDLLVNDGIKAAEAWYHAWDAANLAAPNPIGSEEEDA